MFNITNNKSRTVSDLHLRCIAHVVDLAVKDCLTDINAQINQIRSLLSVMRCSINRSDMYEDTQRQLGLTVALPSMDV